MNEYALIGWSVLNIAVVAVVATLYALGGRANKWIRRFAAPAVLVGYCAWLAAQTGAPYWWAAFLSFPLYVAAYSVGYGESSKLAGILRSKLLVRTVTASAYVFASAGIIFAFSAFRIPTFVFCGGMVVLAVYLTRTNPFPAAMEEYLVAILTTVFVPFFRNLLVLVVAVGLFSGTAWAARPVSECKTFDECMKAGDDWGLPPDVNNTALLKAIAFKLDEISKQERESHADEQ